VGQFSAGGVGQFSSDGNTAAGTEPDDNFATTIVALVCADNFTASVHIGDGLALALTEGGSPALASLPERGDYVNETHFVTDCNWREHARCDFV
jgi:hypothetical protein